MEKTLVFVSRFTKRSGQVGGGNDRARARSTWCTASPRAMRIAWKYPPKTGSNVGRNAKDSPTGTKLGPICCQLSLLFSVGSPRKRFICGSWHGRGREFESHQVHQNV